MKLRRSASRLTAWALGGTLLFLTLFSVWAAVITRQAAEDSFQAGALSYAYDAARYAVAREDFWVTEYLLKLGPDVEHLDPSELRKHHADAAAGLVAALDSRDAYHREEDFQRDAWLLESHDDYLAAAGRLFDAVDANRPQLAYKIELRQIDPAFSALESAVNSRARDQREEVLTTLQSSIRVENLVLWGTIITFSAGLLLLRILWVVFRSNRRRAEEATEAELIRLGRAALTDSLTGLRNHRAFQEDLTEELSRQEGRGPPLSLIMADLNGLKTINDSLGHQAGDEGIQTLALVLASTVRDGRAYRVGGDEFAVIVPGENAWGALQLVHRLHSGLKNHEPTSKRVSVTAGVAAAEKGCAKDTLIKQADMALIEAKGAHRDSLIYSEDLGVKIETPDDVVQEHHLKTLATALARAVDAKDSYTRSHCETVSEICALVASQLGLAPEHIAKLRLAGLLHDVGKIGIADKILQKPSRLTKDEFAIMKTHVTLGQSIVSGAELTEEAIWILHHHERLDGRGYPAGLSGSEVPIESRIILVADAYEAIISDRPYRKGRSGSEAFAELEIHAGTQFDPLCVEALKAALKLEEVPQAA